MRHFLNNTYQCACIADYAQETVWKTKWKFALKKHGNWFEILSIFSLETWWFLSSSLRQNSTLTLSGTGQGIFHLYEFVRSDFVSWFFFSKRGTGFSDMEVSNVWHPYLRILFPFLNFFGGENWDQSGYFDTLTSSFSLYKRCVFLGSSKVEHFSCFVILCLTGLRI